MSIRVALCHKTTYSYGEAVELTPQVVRLRPAPHCRTPITSYSLSIEPEEHFLNWQQDPYGNFLARLVFPKPTRSFTVRVDLIADMTIINPFDFFLDEDVTEFPFEYSPNRKRELAPYLHCDPLVPALADLVGEVKKEKFRTIDYLVEINQVLNQNVGYVIRMEPGVQTPAETLTKGTGSCRDSAWLAVQLLRNLGLAARFVSGYLIQLTADQASLDGPNGPKEDFTDLHAWAEVYIPGAGWIGIDPTSGLLAGEGHIPLAASAEPTSAAAITGSFLWTPPRAGVKLEQDFHFEMCVKRVHEDPRVTLPYTEEQWERLNTLGRLVDSRLAENDVRLTMGGEPTFVSIDDMDGEQWNTAALGKDKERLGEELLGRLKAHYSPGGLLHFGQGKHYPGESLPRWAYRCIWRGDGVPIWKEDSLLARPSDTGDQTVEDGHRFLKSLCAELGLSDEWVRPGYEDKFYYLWREGNLPVNVATEDSKVDWEEERVRLRRVFDQGLDGTIGHLLPLEVTWQDRFRSGPWPLRREELFLIPGDSPMGFRLPLDSLPWMAPSDRPVLDERDPMDAPPPLMQFRPMGSAQFSKKWTAPKVGDSAPEFVRTALCVEVRNGNLYVFLPPLSKGEHFLALISSLEVTAKKTAIPIILEGYGPPHDPRLKSFSITPDPGVLEVNVQPTGSWDELTSLTETLYEEARQTRLGTEKFMLDGRHSGTGGGNHVVLGSSTPADSPFLRRPDLLASMICFWLNHPSLSYLFSGLFVGPTSQAPRIDEARQDSLYELEIALKQLPSLGQDPQLWLVDRLFRHLLTDMTGNTHRAEFCIDKLYSPDSTTGRLGLLELRAFEMPPHARMSLAQQLLVRALVAHFWEKPYREKPIRWGTRLHDQFLLGHFVWQDLLRVLAELRSNGFDFSPSWFEPHFEFRFPQIGSLCRDGIQLNLRTAIEPWHVLGEEPGGGGTVRFVDSSLERLEVRVSGLVEGRHFVSCNGHRLPLQPTGINGEWVAGVRFRAWQPPSCLHPTIGVHVPLKFDIVNCRTGQSIGGCRYGVAHPGGRNYDSFPINANEAEARRTARFTELQFSGDPVEVSPGTIAPEYPYTLDLRRHG